MCIFTHEPALSDMLRTNPTRQHHTDLHSRTIFDEAAGDLREVWVCGDDRPEHRRHVVHVLGGGRIMILSREGSGYWMSLTLPDRAAVGEFRRRLTEAGYAVGGGSAPARHLQTAARACVRRVAGGGMRLAA